MFRALVLYVSRCITLRCQFTDIFLNADAPLKFLLLCAPFETCSFCYVVFPVRDISLETQLRSSKISVGVHERNKACTYCRPWPPRLRLWQGSSCRSYRPPTVTQACFTHAHLICKIYIESNVTIRFLHWAKRILVCCNVTSNTLSLLYHSWYHIWTSQ